MNCSACAERLQDCCHQSTGGIRASRTVADVRRARALNPDIEVTVDRIENADEWDMIRRHVFDARLVFPGPDDENGNPVVPRLRISIVDASGECQMLGENGCTMSKLERPRFCSIFPTAVTRAKHPTTEPGREILAILATWHKSLCPFAATLDELQPDLCLSELGTSQAEIVELARLYYAELEDQAKMSDEEIVEAVR